MPLYATIYLFLFALFSFATTYMHFEENKGFLYVIPEVICYFFLILFVLLYFQPEDFPIDKNFIFIMLIYSFCWQVFSFIGDMKIAKEKFAIQNQELMIFLLISVAFIAPCFLAGIELLR